MGKVESRNAGVSFGSEHVGLRARVW